MQPQEQNMRRLRLSKQRTLNENEMKKLLAIVHHGLTGLNVANVCRREFGQIKN